ncbi:PAS domain-containing protein [Hymenobacter cellulosilyticus]|uniref:PAS domain-containing protein n=1 Tax=Hymenobacter cellulosilyticus TaxID=2932248 RepID=A0A8T9QC59_9BACT|nr:PAS domain-containing protein [Hymenobacter cellulosilyticus]UOQ73941.1 PAS domain-containing protein [Hymenobacter cellulosilyticus]
MFSPSDSAEIEMNALREEIRQLRQYQAAAQELAQQREQHAQSQRRFRTVFENSPLGQKIIAPDLTIRQANAALADMLGVGSAGALVGRRILDFAHPHHRYDWELLQERLWGTRRQASRSKPAWCAPTAPRFGVGSLRFCSKMKPA